MRRKFVTILLALSVLLHGCLVDTHKPREAESTVEKLPVEFVRLMPLPPVDGIPYVNEIRERGQLLGRYGGLSHTTLRVDLEPRNQKIQLCSSGKVLRTVRVNPLKTRRLSFTAMVDEPSPLLHMVGVAGQYLSLAPWVPWFVIAWPIHMKTGLVFCP